MNAETNQSGYFIFSLDTELGTGFFDKDEERKRIFSLDGVLEREKIARILALLDEYEITATWAVVGHIFYERCEECEICPLHEWEGKYKSYDEAYKTDHPLWYGADVIDMLLSARMNHEIGFHGYTHEIFNQISREKAEIEIKEFIRVARRKGIDVKSIVFPRDKVGYLDLFEKYGFLCFREEESLPLLTRNKFFIGKLAKHLDHILAISTPPIYDLEEFGTRPLVNLTATQHIFGFNRSVEVALDQWGLSNLRIRRMTRAIRKAAAQKKVVHIWAHPWEFRREDDIDKLRLIFESVAEEIEVGRMKSIGMADMAKMVIQTYGK